MADKILILGKGYIGDRLKEEFGCAQAAEEIRSFKDANRIVEIHNPKIIVNCIGHIRRNVDDCELDKDRTLLANAFLPLILTEVALRKNIYLVQISSGCIYHFDYDKDRPIREEKDPDFFDLFYSRTKIYSELALAGLSSEFPILIARMRIPLDNRPHPKNLLDKLIHYRKAIDVANSVTYMPDFVLALKTLMQKKATGIYNLVNKGGLFFPRLLDIYKRYVPDFTYQKIAFKELKITRTNLILSTSKLEKSGFKVRQINDVLEECVRSYLSYAKK